MASNREVMARSGFMEVESSPVALQARGSETRFEEIAGNVLEPGLIPKLIIPMINAALSHCK
jgi:hypothetical protein